MTRMTRMVDIAGEVFGLLTVVRSTRSRRHKQIVWECKCECGRKHLVVGRDLRSGHTKSCGCQSRSMQVAAITVHGSASRGQMGLEYRIWIEMKQRCYNPKNSRYATYGGRGISVCSRWLHSYPNFIADMGPKPDSYSIDRKNNDGNYEPSNCRWVPRKEQSRNRTNTVWISSGGEKIRLSDWARQNGIKRSQAYHLHRTGKIV